MPPVYAEEFRTRIRNARVAIMKECAHIPMLEWPEEFVSLLSEFLGASA